MEHPIKRLLLLRRLHIFKTFCIYLASDNTLIILVYSHQMTSEAPQIVRLGCLWWHEIFEKVYFCGLAIFCVMRELIFAIRTDWFFLFFSLNIFVFVKYVSAMKISFLN